MLKCKFKIVGLLLRCRLKMSLDLRFSRLDLSRAACRRQIMPLLPKYDATIKTMITFND